jgi:hypothetical protein
MWKTVAGFEGLYEVSNLGEVRSLERIELVPSKNKQPFIRKRKGRMLKQYVDRYGYMKVVLLKDGKPHYFTVHRLVALAFVDNCEQKDTVDHIDCNRKNNHAENLRWVTATENLYYSHKLGRQIINATPIIAISPSGITHRFISQREAERKTGVKQAAISRALHGKKPNLHGWEFLYDN